MNSQDKELTSVSFHLYGYSPLMCFVKSCNVNEKVKTLREKKNKKKDRVNYRYVHCNRCSDRRYKKFTSNKMICKVTELKCISQYSNGKGVAVRYSSDEESRDKMSSSGERQFQIK